MPVRSRCRKGKPYRTFCTLQRKQSGFQVALRVAVPKYSTSDTMTSSSTVQATDTQIRCAVWEDNFRYPASISRATQTHLSPHLKSNKQSGRVVFSTHQQREPSSFRSTASHEEDQERPLPESEASLLYRDIFNRDIFPSRHWQSSQKEEENGINNTKRGGKYLDIITTVYLEHMTGSGEADKGKTSLATDSSPSGPSLRS